MLLRILEHLVIESALQELDLARVNAGNRFLHTSFFIDPPFNLGGIMRIWSSRRVVVTVSLITAIAILLQAGYGFVSAQFTVPASPDQTSVTDESSSGLMPAPTSTPPPNPATDAPVVTPIHTPEPAIAPTALPPVEYLSKEGPPIPLPTPSVDMLKTSPVYEQVISASDDNRPSVVNPIEVSPIDVRTELNTSRVKRGDVVDVKLVLQTNAIDSALSVFTTLPDGVEYIDKSSSSAKYDAKTRQLSWVDLKPVLGMSVIDQYQLRIEVNTLPVTLKLFTYWQGDKNSGDTTVPIQVGQEATSPQLLGKTGGDTSISDRIKLSIPPGALKVDTQIKALLFAPEMRTSRSGKGDVPVMSFSFSPDMSFARPITLAVNLEGLLDDPELGYGLVIQNEYTETVTRSILINDKAQDEVVVVRSVRDLPTEYDPKTKTFSTQLQHFSDYQIGLQQPADPKPWRINTNAPGVSLFRGAANYSYPFYAPPMAEGLQPQPVLQYSSADADAGSGGNLMSTEPGVKVSVGRGWSLPVPKLTRLVKRAWRQSGSSTIWVTDYKNYFTLELNGKAYTLIRKGGQSSTDFGGWYIPEEHAPIRALRCNSRVSTTTYPDCSIFPVSSWGNTTGEYWHVFTPDGTRYVFGMDSMSTNIVDQRDINSQVYNPNSVGHTVDTYAGSASGVIARTWFLRAVYSPRRDVASSDPSLARWSVAYEYEQVSTSVANPWTGTSASDIGFRPTKILYGNSLLTNGATASTRYEVRFGYSDLTDSRLDAVEVWWGAGSATRIRRYEMSYVNHNLGTDVFWKLTGIVEKFGKGSSWSGYLPSPTFSYAQLTDTSPNKVLLQQFTNGYGGTWTFTYQGNSYANGHHVSQMVVSNGVANAASETHTYSYTSPCYDIPTSACYNPNAHFNNEDYSGQLVGYANVTHKVMSAPGGSILAQDSHVFYTDRQKLARENETRWMDANGTILKAHKNEFAVWANSSCSNWPTGAWYVELTSSKDYPTGDIGSTPQSVTDYNHDCYGNVTRIAESGFGATANDDRTTHYSYINNEPLWIVGKLSRENIYTGIVTTDPNSGVTLLSRTKYYYDGQSWGAVGTKGLLTAIERDKLDGTGTISQQISYNVLGNISMLTDALNRVTSAGYDSTGHFLTSVTNAKSQTIDYYYYGVNQTSDLGWTGRFGDLQGTVDPNGVKALYHYDDYGRLRRISKDVGGATGDTFDRPTEEYFYFDSNSPFLVQRFVRRNVNTGENPWGDGNAKWWTASGAVDTNAIAFWERTFYDGLGREVETQRPMANWVNTGGEIQITWTRYDNFGRISQQSVPYIQSYAGSLYREPVSVNQTSTSYDALSRVISVSGPDSTNTTYGYAADTGSDMGRTPTNQFVRSIIDPKGHAKHYVEDGLGRVIKIREFTGTCYACGGGNNWFQYSVTDYTYDALNNLKQVVDAQSNTTTMSYDGLSRKKEMVDPDMGHWYYNYDSANNLTWQQDGKAQQMWFSYDALNRLTEKRTSPTAGQQVLSVWEYDQGSNGTGHKTHTWASGGNETKWGYDRRGRLTTEYYVTPPMNAVPNWQTTQFTYDQADRLSTTTYPDGELVTHSYNNAGQTTQTASSREVGNGANPNNYVTNTAYNALGKVSQITYGNSSRDQYQYHGVDVFGAQWMSDGGSPFGYLVRKTVWSASNIASLDTQYGYDLAGNIRGRFISNNAGASWDGTQFSYDHLDRLISANSWSGYAGETGSFGYDKIGNLTTKTGVGNLVYPSSGSGSIRPHAVSSTDGGNSFSYDLNGNMRSRTENGVTYTQGWDVNNALTSVTGDNGTLVSYSYDADGNRVKKVEAKVQDLFSTQSKAWDVSGANGTYYSVPYNDGGENVLRTVGDNANWLPYFQRKSDGGLTNGDIVVVDFKLSQTNTDAHFTLDSAVNGYSRWSINNNNNAIQACWMENAAWQGCAPLILYPVANRWYRMKLTIDDSSGFIAEVWERDISGGVSARFQRTFPPSAAGGVWFFFHTLWRGSVSLDNYQEYRKTTGTTVYLGQYSEWFQADTPPNAPALFNPTPTPTTMPPTSTGAPTPTPTSVNTPTPTATPTSVNTPTPTATPSGGGGSNLLTNGGFETGNLNGWEAWGSGLSVNTSNARSGSYGAQSTSGEIRQTVTTVANQTYYVSAWVRINSQQQAATWGGIRVQALDANWNNLNNVVLTLSTSPLGQWTRVQFSFVAAGTLSRLHLGPFTDGQYTTSFDDIIVSASPIAGVPAPGGNKVLARVERPSLDQQSGGSINTRNYYFFNGSRVAMRQCAGTCSSTNLGTVTWLHSDPLGSATLATNASGQPLAGSETRYSPFGALRYGGGGLPNDRRYNGNKTDIAGLLDYGARPYDPLVGRFVSADTIVPDPVDPQAFNRYSYGLNNPVKYTDPTGHVACDDDNCNSRDEAVAMTSSAATMRYVNWQLGSAFHALIEFDFVLSVAPEEGLINAYGSDLPGGRGMFSIDGAGPQSGPGYPDLWYNQRSVSRVTFINDIKPDTPSGLVAGDKQMNRYQRSCGIACQPGNIYPTNTGAAGQRRVRIPLPVLDILYLTVRNAGGGVLAYTSNIDIGRVLAYGSAGEFIRRVRDATKGVTSPAPIGQPVPRRVAQPFILQPQSNPLTVNHTIVPLPVVVP